MNTSKMNFCHSYDQLKQQENELWKAICLSKEQNHISDDKKEQYICRISKLIEKRVDGIMQGNYRKYYYECASYIAAMGDVLELRGLFNAKQTLMHEYRTKYSRKRNFVAVYCNLIFNNIAIE